MPRHPKLLTQDFLHNIMQAGRVCRKYNNSSNQDDLAFNCPSSFVARSCCAAIYTPASTGSLELCLL